MTRLIDAYALMQYIRNHDYQLVSRMGCVDKGMFTDGIEHGINIQPTVEAVQELKPCHMCDNAFVNEDLTRDEDLSYVGLGDSLLGYRAMLRSGDGKPVEIIMEHWNGAGWEEVGHYRPAFCPNCGRELVENKQFKQPDPCGFRRCYSPELINASISDEAVLRLREGF